MSLLTTIISSLLLIGSNDPVALKGVIKDKTTDEPIPFAHITVGDIVNVTNVDGEFIINADHTLEGESMEVSYMGYAPFSQTIEDSKAYHSIYLEPSTIHLDEVVVWTGESIMKHVFDRLHMNYHLERQHIVGYYKETMSSWNATYYLAEGVMDIYVPNDMDRIKQPLVSPIKTRKMVFKSFDEDEFILGGNASDMAHSSIWRKESFLSNKNRDEYDYTYSGHTSLGNNDVLIVDFEPKSKQAHTNGKIYVEENTFAIVRIEYHPIIKDLRHWESVSWVEEYEQQKGVYELCSVSFQGLSIGNNFEYKAILVINESKTIDEIPNNPNYLTSFHSLFDEAKEDFSDSFWEDFNFVKLDMKSEQLLHSAGIYSR